MTLQGAQASEIRRYHAHAKVTPAITRTRVTCMQVAIVDQLDLIRMQRALQFADDALRARGATHFELPCGSFGLSAGSLFASHSPWPIANAAVSPIIPYSLKFTHVASEKL